MSATLVARGLSAGHGERVLFEGLDLVIAPGDIVALVGPNGAGKSTLLRILAGLAEPDDGTISLAPPDATIGYLPQEPERRPTETVREFLRRRTGVHRAEQEMEAAADALAHGAATDREPDAGEAYGHALERWLALGGADLDDRAEALAETSGVGLGLGLGVGLDAPMTALSGGQAARAGLASLLLSRYDVFLLDEPTNDLDIDGLERLEQFVAGLRAGAVVVSHDREFLSRTATRVVELDPTQQRVGVYGGGYDAYLEEREVARRHARDRYEEYADTLSGLRERARMQREWLDKGVRDAVRKQRDNDKVGRKFRTEQTEKQAAKARQTERLIERLDVVEEPRKEWELRLSIAEAPRSGDVVAVASAATVRRGDFVLGPVTLAIERGDRVAIVGPNGSGKSTLLALLLGRLTPDEGTAGLGRSVVVGEIDQARGLFLGGQPLVRAFGDKVPDWGDADVRTLLAKFGLGAEHVTRAAASLSPGERTRAALALLQARGVNLLVLDEPTNHLDLPAIEQLESALASFAGTMLLVSHDRRLLTAIDIGRRVTVDDGQVTTT